MRRLLITTIITTACAAGPLAAAGPGFAPTQPTLAFDSSGPETLWLAKDDKDKGKKEKKAKKKQEKHEQKGKKNKEKQAKKAAKERKKEKNGDLKISVGLVEEKLNQ